MLITPLVLFTTIFTTPQYRFEPFHTELEFDEPIQVVFDGITDKFFYVAEKDGVVRRVSTEPE